MTMKTYLVGGAVRDALLGLAVRERDWVVVGAHPDELAALGYKAVGRDFPVFLHPQTNEEYALARTERKTGPGYRGFVTRFGQEVTLEQDLERRDLTINAIARDMDTGMLIDPYGGQRDLAARVLRHVSAAFIEDPVRVLRVARFAARFAPQGFTVAQETLELMRQIAANGELDALVAERVWQETHKALVSTHPHTFFGVLRDAQALKVIFPEIDALFGVPQPAQWHPEIDTGVHTLMVLEQAARLSAEPSVRFAALTHDLGKGVTPKEHWPKHHGHEAASVLLLEELCVRLRVPNEYRECAIGVARYHGHAHRALELRASTLLELLENLDAFRRPARFEEFLLACEADMRGRTGFEERAYPQADYLRRAQAIASAVKLDPATLAALPGPKIGERIREARLAALKTGLHAAQNGS
jgi:tRNA nucleotidyltransferase (CCA-adding enzyme)